MKILNFSHIPTKLEILLHLGAQPRISVHIIILAKPAFAQPRRCRKILLVFEKLFLTENYVEEK